MDYERFLDNVRDDGGFRDRDETKAIVANVFRAIAEVLPQKHAADLSDELPGELMVYLRGAHTEPDPYFDKHLFLGWVVSTIDVTGERDKTTGGLDLYADYSGDEAMRRCQCVFKVLKSTVGEDHRMSIGSYLPDGISALYQSA
ncbi:MAG: DUF2267 domain-containing protein [Dehalococcoidia bacterium]